MELDAKSLDMADEDSKQKSALWLSLSYPLHISLQVKYI